VVYPDVASELANWIATGQQLSREELTAKLWNTAAVNTINSQLSTGLRTAI